MGRRAAALRSVAREPTLPPCSIDSTTTTTAAAAADVRASPTGAGPGGRELASPGMRVLARILDAIILGIVFGGVFAAIILSGDDDAGLAGFGTDTSLGRAYLIGLLGVAVGFVWDAVSHEDVRRHADEVGRSGCRSCSRTGPHVEWAHAIKRWAFPGAFGLVPPIAVVSALLSLVQLVVVIVSLVFIFSKPLRTAVWDLFAGTVVVTSR